MKKSLFIMAISIILLLSITATFASDVNDNETIANEIDESIMETSDEVESPDMLLDYVESEESASDITDEEDLSSESDILKEGDESEKMYGYWVNSVDMKNFNLTDLKEHGVTDILLNYYAYNRFNQSDVEVFISDANDLGIKTHIWTQIFYSTGHWFKPVVNGLPNQEYFYEKILELEKYANTSGVAGINFDYLRFSGSVQHNNSAVQNPGGIEAISEFVRQSTQKLRKINPNIILSAALMPEIEHLEDWYGYNYTVISECMDVITPMIYTGNFRQNATWVENITKWFVENSKHAKVWTGLQGYTVNDIEEEVIFNSPSSQMAIEIKASEEGGSAGAVIFRYGVCNNIDFINLPIDENEFTTFNNLDYLISCSRNLALLDRDFAFNSTHDSNYTNGIGIHRANLIIDGQGHFIDAKGLARIFNVTKANITFQNIKFINAYSKNGGALYLTGNNVKIINCTFINCKATVEGGAIFLKAPNASIENSRFINNTAVYNAAVYMNSANASVIGSTFENNRADISAGAIGWAKKDNGIIDKCKFVNNSAHDEGGGAIFWNQGLNGKILNSIFTNNYANYNGSAIFWSYGNDGLIDNCTFTNNTATQTGGAIYIKGENDTISNSRFINNTAKKGGAIGTTNKLSMINNTFSNNNPDNMGSLNPTITAKSASYIINYSGKYIITLKDGIGNPIEGRRVSFTLNGKNIGYRLTDSKGMASIQLTAKILKTAKYGKKNLVITFDDVNYNKVTKTVKITINKEKTKLVAKKAKFKKSKKTKKYTVKLKNSKGKAVKKVKVRLKIKKKIYYAKTNSKRKATFKIKKLSKKGKYTVKITFKSTALYKGSSKKVKITLK